MPVYVDDGYAHAIVAHRRVIKPSVMVATSTRELVMLCREIDLPECYVQNPGQFNERFVISLKMRKKAITAGAVPSSRQFVLDLIDSRDSSGDLFAPC